MNDETEVIEVKTYGRKRVLDQPKSIRLILEEDVLKQMREYRDQNRTMKLIPIFRQLALVFTDKRTVELSNELGIERTKLLWKMLDYYYKKYLEAKKKRDG